MSLSFLVVFITMVALVAIVFVVRQRGLDGVLAKIKPREGGVRAEPEDVLDVVALTIGDLTTVLQNRYSQYSKRPSQMRLVSLKKDKLLDSWAVILEGAAGTEEYLLNEIWQELLASELPGVTWTMVNVTPSWLKGLFGSKRQYILVTNRQVKDFRMYVGARDYGKHLDVSWFLTVEPGFFKRLLSRLVTYALFRRKDPRALSFATDIFGEQELRAYVTAVHRCCVRKAVERVVEQMGKDHSHFDWKSKGFLSVW